MAINIRYYMPAISFKTFWGIVSEPALNFTIDRDVVVIVESDQFTQTQRTSQGTGFMRNTLHQTTVTQENVGVMVDDFMAIAVEVGSQSFFSNCHSNTVGNTLAKRTRCGFHPGGIAIFRMPRGLGMQLAKLLEILDAEVIACQMQQ